MGRTPGQGTPGCGDGEVGGTRVGGPGMEGTGVGVTMGPPHPLYLPPPTPEPSDRDLSCLLASLVQLLADPHARSLRGFQSLVQREWVAAGHPFPQRLGLRRDSPREEVTTPNPSAVSPPRGRRPHLTSPGVTPVRLPPPRSPPSSCCSWTAPGSCCGSSRRRLASPRRTCWPCTTAPSCPTAAPSSSAASDSGAAAGW